MTIRDIPHYSAEAVGMVLLFAVAVLFAQLLATALIRLGELVIG
ncbi:MULTISPECIES: hypothetical protein [Sphingomonas]|jgi:hypothetical protein|nr:MULTISPECIES: hypothetical protein [Sphingomonas]